MRGYLQLKNKLNQPTGFSLVEVLVATALFAGMVSVLLSAFVNAKRLAEPSLLNGIQSNLARAELEKLYNAVDESTWNNEESSENPIPPSADGPTTISLPDIELNGKTFERSYIVSDVGNEFHDLQYRKVTVRINEKEI